MFYQRIIILLFLLFLIGGCQTTAQQQKHSGVAPFISAVVEQSKGENDPAQYDYLTLENGLKVLLVSDMGQLKGYASLSVAAGYFQDPDALPGLAHLYEHMLSKGSEKYPDAAEYKAFLAENGGRSNASTSSERTNYYFQVANEAFDVALDRFAWQFIRPLLPQPLVYQERHAVEAEFQMKFRDNYRRKREVLRTQVEPSHPYRKFSTGNLTTLQDLPDISLHQAIVRFGDDFYCAPRMAAVLVAPRSLPELAELATAAFAALPEDCNAAVSALPSPFENDLHDRLISIKTLRKRNRLTIGYAVRETENQRRMMAADYVEWLLESNNVEGLESILRQQGLITRLEVSRQRLDRNHLLLNIEFRLTTQGSAELKTVRAACAEYIRLIREQGTDMALFRQYADLQRTAFDRDNSHLQTSAIRDLADKVLFRLPEQILLDEKVPSGEDGEVLAGFLRQLQPYKRIQVREKRTLDGNQIEPIYQTDYKVSTAPPILSAGQATGTGLSMSLPVLSPYYATQSSVDKRPYEELTAITSTPAYSAWYLPAADKNDAFMSVEIYFDSNQQIADFSLLNPFFVKRLQRHLHSVISSADQALIDVDLDATRHGFRIRLSGYGGHWTRLMTDVVAAINSTDNLPASRALTLRLYRSELDNAMQARLSSQTLDMLDCRLSLQACPAEREVYFSQFDERKYDEFVRAFWQQARVQALFYGNTDQKLAQSFEDTLSPVLAKIASPVKSMNTQWLLPAEPLAWHETVTGKDSAIRLMYVPEQQSVASDLVVALLGNIARAPFFHQLRTQEQLGYSVRASAGHKYHRAYFGYYVQSPRKSATQLAQRIDQFNGWLLEQIAQLGPQAFADLKRIMATQLKQPFLNNESAAREQMESHRVGRPNNDLTAQLKRLQDLTLNEFQQRSTRLLGSQPFALLADPQVANQP